MACPARLISYVMLSAELCEDFAGRACIAFGDLAQTLLKGPIEARLFLGSFGDDLFQVTIQSQAAGLRFSG